MHLRIAAMIFATLIMLSGIAHAEDRSKITVVGKSSEADLRKNLPSDATLTKKGTDSKTGLTTWEITGAKASDVSKIHRTKGINSAIDHGEEEFTTQQLRDLAAVGEAILALAAHDGWRYTGSKWEKSRGGTFAPNPRPKDKKVEMCWVCNDCGSPPNYPPYPGPEKNLCKKDPGWDDAWNDYQKKAALEAALQIAVEKLGKWYNFKSAAKLVKDIGKAASLLIPIPGSSFAVGTLIFVAEMVAEGVMDALMDSFLESIGFPDGINSLAAAKFALDKATKANQEAYKKWDAMRKAYIDCINKNQKAGTLAKDKEEADASKQAIQDWLNGVDKYLDDYEKWEKCYYAPDRCKWVQCK